MQFTAVHSRFLKLCACTELPASAGTLAEAAASMCGAIFAAVFLQDYSAENLVLTARHPQNHPVAQDFKVPLTDNDDPLCFSVFNGKTCKVAAQTYGVQPLSVRGLNAPPNAAWVTVMPLAAPGRPGLGAILLMHAEKPDYDEQVMDLLCLYGGATLELAVERRRHAHSLNGMRQDLTRLEEEQAKAAEADRNIVGESAAINRLRAQIPAIARSPATVLITGETGTGKSLVAKALHEASPRAKNPFVEINCGALPENLLESELFGHVKGAFTGADSERPGLFRSAHGGTVFLDEIGNLTPNLQAVLLHVLQEKRVRPVGGVRDYAVDFRIIAATNADLEQAIGRGSFRADLYHRLAVVTMRMPSLADRLEDIPLLASWFLERFKKQYRCPQLSLSPQAMQALMNMNFPGNIRELSGKIEQAVMLAEPGTTQLLPGHFQANSLDGFMPADDCPTLADYLNRQEEAIIKSTLMLHGGNMQRAADSLGVPRRTLARKTAKYGINNRTYQNDGAPVRQLD